MQTVTPDTLHGGNEGRHSEQNASEYRLEIDGLRAIAIVAVLLFHLSQSFIPRGFLGVDIFFVISGFLITQKIVRHLQENNFTFTGFYTNRIKRLFPALLVTIVLTFMVSIFILSPIHLAELGLASVFSIFPLANILYWLQAGYFDASNITKPLLHTWSLGVEEQFYILWPLLLVVFRKYFKSKYMFFAAISFVGVLSLVGAYVGYSWNPAGVFYLTPFRVFQFCLGAVGLVLLDTIRLHRWAKEGMLVLGIVMMILPMCLTGPELAHVSIGTTLIASLGALITIIAGNATIVGLLLRNRVSVYLGKISYALYLVHWPLIVLYQYKGYSLSDSYGVIGLFSLSLFLAWILHKYIELPFWKGDLLKKNFLKIKVTTIGIVAVIVFIFVGLHAWNTGGWDSRYSKDVQTLIQNNKEHNIKKNNEIFRAGQCMIRQSHPTDTLESYCYASNPAEKNVLLIGDSQAADLFSGFQAALGDEWSVYQATGTGCGCLHACPKGIQYCSVLGENIYEDILVNYQYDLVVIVGRRAHDEAVEHKKRLEAMGIDYVFMGRRPEYTLEVPQILSNAGSVFGIEQAFAKYRKEDTYVEDASAEYPHHYFSQIRALCSSADNCVWRSGDELLYMDKIHFSWVGSAFMGRAFKTWLNNREVGL